MPMKDQTKKGVIMGVWAVLKNIGTILSLLKALRDIVAGATEKKLPEREQIKAVLDHVETLLDNGAIDIPGVDEKQISEALKQVEEFIMRGNEKAA